MHSAHRQRFWHMTNGQHQTHTETCWCTLGSSSKDWLIALHLLCSFCSWNETRFSWSPRVQLPVLFQGNQNQARHLSLDSTAITHAHQHSKPLLHIYRQPVDSILDARSQEPTHLNWQDCEFPSGARTWWSSREAEKEEQTCSGLISSSVKFFIRSLSPVPRSPAAPTLHAASILYTAAVNSCLFSHDITSRK